MTIETLPFWSVPPDWSDDLTETLEWLTAIFGSTTGTEQRQALRTAPRRSLEFTVRVYGAMRNYFDNLLSTSPQGAFYVPVWYEFDRLSRGAVIGQTLLNLRGSNHAQLASATIVCLVGEKPWQYELAELASSSVNNGLRLTLTAPLTQDWPEDTLVYPVTKAILEAQPQFTRTGDRFIAASVRFISQDPQDWAGLGDLPTYLGYAVVEMPVNEADNQTGGYDRISLDLDNTIGPVLRLDLAETSFAKFTSATFFSGRVDNDYIRSLLYTFRGRLSALWLAYPMEDFEIIAPAGIGDASLVVRRNGFTDLTGPVSGREDIRIMSRDGTAQYRRIVGCAILDDETESLTLDSGLDVAITPASVLRVSFMAIGRLDQDKVDLVHKTDSDGVCTVSLAFRAAPDLRDAEDWSPPALPNPDAHCGGPVQFQFFARVNDGPWNDDDDADPTWGIGGIDISSIGATFRPVVGINTAFIGGQIVTFNFGATPFTADMAGRTEGWGGTLNPDDTSGVTVVVVEPDDLGMFGGGEEFGGMGRAFVSSGTIPGLHGFQCSIDNSDDLVSWVAGVAADDYDLTTPTSGTFDNEKLAVVHSNGVVRVGGVTVATLAGLSAGDVLTIVIFC